MLSSEGAAGCLRKGVCHKKPPCPWSLNRARTLPRRCSRNTGGVLVRTPGAIRASLRKGGPMSISRRDFLGTAAVGAVAAPLVSATGMPMRTLGRTGAKVSILAFGGGSRFVQYEEDKGIE